MKKLLHIINKISKILKLLEQTLIKNIEKNDIHITYNDLLFLTLLGEDTEQSVGYLMKINASTISNVVFQLNRLEIKNLIDVKTKRGIADEKTITKITNHGAALLAIVNKVNIKLDNEDIKKELNNIINELK